MVKIVAVVGTNASGKSSLGVDLAERFNGQVISADSRQVYRRLDLGSGKLTEAEMRGIPHHLIDVVDLDVTFSLADYQRLAYQTIDDVQAEGSTPFLVGGTGLYVTAVTQGYRLLDVAPNPALRAELEGMSESDLWERLSAVDPKATELIDRRNTRRIVRALELSAGGVRYSEQYAPEPRYTVLALGLTWPPEVLRERIYARLTRRMTEGMVEEAVDLLDSGVSPATLDSLGLEYRHLLRYIQGVYKSEDELVKNLATNIYQFSRKQLIWFRRDSNIHWLDSSGDYMAEASTLISEYLER
ncbi:MAG: tRNA ((37)-N6)-dimethylallyltransferase MiaA [Amycolatopsis sp.]|uniref:tRNA (adenosine(37)-N6)-dimethylallyltransferase MiaA n=1 Tax=Amycolatopsis sp. TaxID=37632 RepID=UPI002636727C|nr:tRNA (adenosine(37)-N6)-dimethylallyltransferase MiaA [Amycolatopsis sp.]MCU1685409.1 tRNA ((37)-N6)-dimethylallyltransferase MiaA [Amycolatopsis sp.]